MCFAEGPLVRRRSRVDRVMFAEIGIPLQQCIRMCSSNLFRFLDLFLRLLVFFTSNRHYNNVATYYWHIELKT